MSQSVTGGLFRALISAAFTLTALLNACATSTEELPFIKPSDDDDNQNVIAGASGTGGATATGGTSSSGEGGSTSGVGGTNSSAGTSNAAGTNGDAGSGTGSCTERTWYKDVDDDGFGTPDDSVKRCDQPNGFVDNADDCNDDDEFIFPDADELCDGVDNDCEDSTPDVCPTGCKALSHVGHAYMLCAGPVTGSVAESACADQNMRLMSIDDSVENAFLQGSITATTWVGGKDSAKEGTWEWSDGADFFVDGAAVNGAFVNWNTGEPNAATAEEDCLEVLTSGKWNDNPCSRTRAFCCERF